MKKVQVLLVGDQVVDSFVVDAVSQREQEHVLGLEPMPPTSWILQDVLQEAVDDVVHHHQVERLSNHPTPTVKSCWSPALLAFAGSGPWEPGQSEP